MHRCWKGLPVFVAFLVLFNVLPMRAWAAPTPTPAPLQTEADSAVLMDPTTGTVLFEKNPHKRVAPASVTKLMTMLIAVEALEQGRISLEDRVVTSQRAYEMGGSQIYLEPGEEMSMKDLLASIAVQSANDACVAVAEHLSGSYEAFVEEMNKKAESLGLQNTHFANPHGLPAENHYTSAYDMATVAREALKYPKVREFFSIKHYKIRPDSAKPMLLDNHNKLLWWYPGSDGFKTGWTSEAKYCLVSTVEREGLRFVAAVFGVPEIRGHFKESMKLYNYGFARYTYRSVAKAGEVLGNVPVGKGEKETVSAIPRGTPGILVERGKEKGIESRIELQPYVDAPVSAGQKIGELVILQSGNEIRRVDLVAKEEVASGKFSTMMTKMMQKMYGFQ
nr:D-alanyl-D-alanine carboxypeptidase family protein [Heliobacterium mobile]